MSKNQMNFGLLYLKKLMLSKLVQRRKKMNGWIARSLVFRQGLNLVNQCERLRYVPIYYEGSEQLLFANR
jgi:hypothetical protein